jgi:menaquinone-specific isochorismate synthase
MSGVCDSMAWLVRSDGSVVVGYGPFVGFAEMPEGEVAFYVQDFGFGSELPWKVPSRVECLTVEDFSMRYGAGGGLDVEWDACEPLGFAGVFQEVMAAIHGGQIQKTVPVVTETGVVEGDPAGRLLGSVARLGLPLHAYGWVDGGRGFAGATPELLFALTDRHLETMALAGTARVEDREVFKVDEKEIREHEYVTQALIAKLLDAGEVVREKRDVLNLGAIVHFMTRIRVELSRRRTPTEWLALLHPTPALGPHPRTVESLGMLRVWRERLGAPAEFGAPFGVVEGGRFDAVVAIRGLWWEGERIFLPSGCGVIEASRLVNEWRELRLKREAVKRFFGGSVERLGG